MKIELKPDKYVVAVSGGVDSIVLLNLLLREPNLSLVVAHYDHGIRKNSVADRKFVEALAKKHKLEFFYEAGKLGPNTGEAVARAARYDFLHRLKNQTGAKAIVTAHHQDDMIETAIINLLRGTGRRGLSSLKSTSEIKRPLLHFYKNEIIAYARQHKLTWREDKTNQDEKYLRNWVRRQITPKLTTNQRQDLLNSIEHAAQNNQTIEKAIDQMLASHSKGQSLERAWFNNLPHDVAKEALMGWLKKQGVQLERRRLEQLVIAAKTLAAGKSADVNKSKVLKTKADQLALVSRER